MQVPYVRIVNDLVRLLCRVSEDELVLRLGAGRFGSFAENFRVPSDVDLDQLKGSKMWLLYFYFASQLLRPL